MKQVCIEKNCNNGVSSKTTKRCQKCYLIRLHRKGINHPRYIDNRTNKQYFCKDCGKEITYSSGFYGESRCKACSKKGKERKPFTIETRQSMSKSAKDKKHVWMEGKNNPIFKIKIYGKGAYYKNIWMRSSWEIKFAYFLDLSGYKWLYESKTFDLGNMTYTPDFYIPEWDLYIEIKGYWRKDAKRKFKLFKKLNPKVRIEVLAKKYLEKLGTI